MGTAAGIGTRVFAPVASALITLRGGVLRPALSDPSPKLELRTIGNTAALSIGRLLVPLARLHAGPAEQRQLQA